MVSVYSQSSTARQQLHHVVRLNAKGAILRVCLCDKALVVTLLFLPVLGTGCGLSKAFAARRRAWRSPSGGPSACYPPEHEDCQSMYIRSMYKQLKNEAVQLDTRSQQHRPTKARHRTRMCRTTAQHGRDGLHLCSVRWCSMER